MRSTDNSGADVSEQDRGTIGGQNAECDSGNAGHQPVGAKADLYEVVFSTDKAEFRRRDAGIESHLEVTVSPEHPAEVRRP